MKFVARTKAPSENNKYYINVKFKGYDRAMAINKKTGFCLANCCGLVHGRWLESQKQTNYKKHDKLCTGDAENYYNFKDGYERGKTPKVGAISCWKGKGDLPGHVSFVEKVYSNGDFLSSNSAYSHSKFYMKKYLKSKNYYMGDNYIFQGFIYNPTKFDSDTKKVYYIVKKGDTLISIAKKYNTTATKLAKLNKLKNPNLIKVGQKLRVK